MYHYHKLKSEISYLLKSSSFYGIWYKFYPFQPQFGGISAHNIMLEFCDFPGNRIRVHAIRHNPLHKSLV